MGAALSSVVILFFQWYVDSTYSREHKFHSVFALRRKLWSRSSRPAQVLTLLGPITIQRVYYQCLQVAHECRCARGRKLPVGLAHPGGAPGIYVDELWEGSLHYVAQRTAISDLGRQLCALTVQEGLLHAKQVVVLGGRWGALALAAGGRAFPRRGIAVLNGSFDTFWQGCSHALI
jgi:hypothetical protein